MYSIGEVAKKLNISISTIRYYDSEGLLNTLKRNSKGERKFDDKDIVDLSLICCLKSAGLKLSEIKCFVDLCKKGPESFKQRVEFFDNREKLLIEKIEELNYTLSLIKFDKWYYGESLKKGYEEDPKDMDMPKEMKKILDRFQEKEKLNTFCNACYRETNKKESNN